MKEGLGQRLKALRDRKGWSQARLAAAAGVPVGSLKNYEQGIRTPTLIGALRLARALGVSVEEWVDGLLPPGDQPPLPPPRPAG